MDVPEGVGAATFTISLVSVAAAVASFSARTATAAPVEWAVVITTRPSAEVQLIFPEPELCLLMSKVFEFDISTISDCALTSMSTLPLWFLSLAATA